MLAKNFSWGPLWITGKIFKKSGGTTFLVKLPDGQVIRHHTDQLKHSSLDTEVPLQQDVGENGYCQMLTRTNLIKR